MVDPVDVSSVSIFKYDTYASSAVFIPSSLLVSAQPLMQFAPSGVLGVPDATGVSGYYSNWGEGTDFSNASGIFKLGTGNYVVPMRMDKALSGVWEGYQLESSAGAAAAATYVDIWTVRLAAGSDYQCIVNIWNLFDNAYYALTDPLILKTKASLSNKHIPYGSIVDLTAPVEVTVQNRDIDESIINVLKSTLITSGLLKLPK